MADGATLTAGPRFRVGAVLSRAAGIFFRHLPIFLVVGVIPALPDPLISHFYTPSTNAARAVAAWAHNLTIFVWTPICQAIILYAAFQDMRHRPVHLGESIGKGVARILPVIGVGFCTSFITGLAMLLFVVPGIIVYIKYSVALPVCVVEQLGVSASLRRSGELTAGYRWQIFGLLLVAFLATMVFIAIALVASKLTGSLGDEIVNFIATALSTPLFSIIFVVTYHDLRAAKEGIDIERIAAVFD